MQSTNIRNIFSLHRYKVVLIVLPLLMLAFQGHAQRNYLEYINKKLYFGITMGYHMSKFKLVHDESFIYDNSVDKIISTSGPGFTLGIVSNLKLGKYFDLRFLPGLTFADKKLRYTFSDGEEVVKTIESISVDFPLAIRFKSMPIGDMKFYVLAGLKYGIDLASNAKARRAEDQVKVMRSDLSYEYGIGLQFFFPLFIFSPEVKFSNGFLDLHARDQNLIYSSTVDKLFSRSIVFSLHFEG